MRKTQYQKKGFTLIELLIVIGIIAVMSALIFVALDPLTRFRKARDAKRWTDVTSVLEAIKIDQVDNGGYYVSAVSGLTDDLYYTVGTCTTGGDSGCTAKVTQAACCDLTDLVTEGYLGSIPYDSVSGSASKTDYYIQKKLSGIVTIGACDPEDASAISVSR